jgi:hypothetical protein
MIEREIIAGVPFGWFTGDGTRAAVACSRVWARVGTACHDLRMDPDAPATLRQLKSLAGARTWAWGLTPAERTLLQQRLRSFSSQEQIALLRSCVALMPQFRGRDSYQDGSLLYEAAVLLYKMKLPLNEADLCELLRTASHTCGHGQDVRPPVDLARDYMRRDGYSPAIMAAVEDFRAALPPVRAAKIHYVRRAIDLLGVFTPRAKPQRGLRPWSADVADHLAGLPAGELRYWQQLALGMVVREQHRIPATWERVAIAFIDDVGADRVAMRLQGFWPASHAEVSLKQGGAQLLKHFLWMLPLLPERPAGEKLASRIPTMTWRRQDPPIGILKAAAVYLEPSTSPAAHSARALLLQQISAAGAGL